MASPMQAGCASTGDPAGHQTASELDRLTLQPASFPLGQAAPDTESLIVTECILKALGTHLATAAYTFGFAGRAALLREEGLRIGLRAQRAILPALLPGIICADA